MVEMGGKDTERREASSRSDVELRRVEEERDSAL